jgi:type IV fimbrial biogenesis protein FimT
MRVRSRAGFTLIEVMIGLTIMAVLMVMGLPSFTAWLQKGQIRTAAEAIQNGLSLARAEAVRRNAKVSFSMAGPDSSWTVAVVNPPQSIQARTSAEGSSNAIVAVAAPGALPVAIEFDGLGRTDLAANLMIQVTNPVGGACGTGLTQMRCLNVQVTPGGTIRMCDPDPSVLPGDTRRC